MALKQYFYIVLVPLKFIPKRTASFWQTIKIPNRFVLKICTGGFADYKNEKINGINNLIKRSMEDTLSFLFLCATGVACYWFFFKCVDWFEKI